HRWSRDPMCAACGVPTHVAVLEPAEPPATGQPAKFAALRNPECRTYLGGAALAMMADNIEHVITYWVVWERFHSPALTGFEVISHWLMTSKPVSAGEWNLS